VGGAFFQPGIGYGGSCLPKDVAALAHTGDSVAVSMRVLAAVQEVNTAQRKHAVNCIRQMLGSLEGRVVAAWGITFKGGTEDTRESPALDVIALLRNEGASVRIFNTYGPRMAPGDGRVIPAFIEACLAGRPIPIEGDGRQTRSFCYVDDLVRGLIAVALDRDASSEVFNLGNPAEYTIRELAAVVAATADVPLNFEFVPAAPDSPTRRRPDIAKVRGRYGWSPRTPLREGIGLTLADFAARLTPALEAAP
jgi:hypothetical protein